MPESGNVYFARGNSLASIATLPEIESPVHSEAWEVSKIANRSIKCDCRAGHGMGKWLSKLFKEFLEEPAKSKLALWVVGIHSLAGCVILATYGFVKNGVGLAILYGLGGWLWGAIDGIVIMASFWGMLKLVAGMLSGGRLF